MQQHFLPSLLLTAMVLPAVAVAQTPERQVIDGYANLAHVMYTDSLATALDLQTAVHAFVATPTAEGLETAKIAWRAARAPYQQTEAYRFGNLYVDEWEGKVNAWPLDEGLIDYVDTGFYGDFSEENDFYLANVIATTKLTVGGQSLDASIIDATLLQALHEVDGVEANVATGYHAIEFLLWGQDVNGTQPGAGQRPHTDFVVGEDCTNGNCARRANYLVAVTDLLIADLHDIVVAWGNDGEARGALAAQGDGEGLSTILTGMGSLSYGELAGERMQLGLILHDPEEEHDCFADNTHNSHFYDAKGIQNVYLGTYTDSKGERHSFPSLSGLVATSDPALNSEVTAALATTMDAMGTIKERADSGIEAYDQMIGAGNAEGNALVQAAIDALVAQTRSIEKIVAVVHASQITVEGSDSLDNPDAVFAF